MMLTGRAKMVRIPFGEDDRWEGKPVYEAIVEEARRQDLGGRQPIAVSKGMERARAFTGSTSSRRPICR